MLTGQSFSYPCEVSAFLSLRVDPKLRVKVACYVSEDRPHFKFSIKTQIANDDSDDKLRFLYNQPCFRHFVKLPETFAYGRDDAATSFNICCSHTSPRLAECFDGRGAQKDQLNRSIGRSKGPP